MKSDAFEYESLGRRIHVTESEDGGWSIQLPKSLLEDTGATINDVVDDLEHLLKVYWLEARADAVESIGRDHLLELVRLSHTVGEDAMNLSRYIIVKAAMAAKVLNDRYDELDADVCEQADPNDKSDQPEHTSAHLVMRKIDGEPQVMCVYKDKARAEKRADEYSRFNSSKDVTYCVDAWVAQ